jgi:hypothetical protein
MNINKAFLNLDLVVGEEIGPVIMTIEAGSLALFGPDFIRVRVRPSGSSDPYSELSSTSPVEVEAGSHQFLFTVRMGGFQGIAKSSFRLGVVSDLEAAGWRL